MIARLLRSAVLALGLAASPAAAHAADSILVQVGGAVSGRVGEVVIIPVSVRMQGAPGRALGGYRVVLSWNRFALSLSGVEPGSFAQPLYNTDSAYSAGTMRLTALLPAGATGDIELFTVRMYVVSDTATSPITVTVEDLTASAGSATPFEDLTPLARVVNGVFCRTLGLWGDVDQDGRATSRDALIALSAVVGQPPADSTILLALGDVDGDGSVTSRDALVILSHAVGLPVPGFRVLLRAPACGGGAASATLVVLPDTLELQVGQTAMVAVLMRDAQGRTVPASGVQWTSADASIAGIESEFEIRGRDAGTTTLTASMGPGVRGQLVVVVTGRRTTWYADVRRALGAVTQTGTVRHPFAFIGDAVEEARSGDTILVAGGTYEEVISDGKAVVILGDSLDRAVVDPRGATYYYNDAIYLGDYGNRTELRHLVVRHGSIELYSNDVVIRNVRMEDIAAYTALYIYGDDYYGGDAPPAGAGRAADFGQSRALVDNLQIVRFSNRGLMAYYTDSVEVRNSTIVGDSTVENCYPGGGGQNAIGVDYADWAYAHDNTVSGVRCSGIALYASDQAIMSRNRVERAGSAGLVGSARVVRSDHNVVRNIGADTSYWYYAYGLFINDDTYVDSVTSVGDSLSNLRGLSPSGVYVEEDASVLVDSLVLDSVGLNSQAYEGTGVRFDYGGRLEVRNSRLSRIRSDGIYASGLPRATVSRNNRFREIGQTALRASYSCECSGGSDTLLSVGDSIAVAGSGVYFQAGRWSRIDSAVVDSANDALRIGDADQAWVTNSVARRSNRGIELAYNDTSSIRNVRVEFDTTGIQVYGGLTTLYGLTVNGNGVGVLATGSAMIVLDSSVMSGNATGFETSADVRVTRTRFQGNGTGVLAQTATGLSIARSNFMGNTLAGIENIGGNPVDADSNYWNDAVGPRCGAGASGCTGTTGDFVVGAGITFAPFETGLVPTPARQGMVTYAGRRRGATPAREPTLVAAPVPVRPEPPPRPVRSTAQVPPGRRPPAWQKGRPQSR